MTSERLLIPKFLQVTHITPSDSSLVHLSHAVGPILSHHLSNWVITDQCITEVVSYLFFGLNLRVEVVILTVSGSSQETSIPCKVS